MSKQYDAIIIGGGNAGFGVSSIVSEAGKSMAFIEDREFGGTCPNRGCTPKKILVAAAQTLHEIENAGIHGIEVGKPYLDWGKLIKREKTLIAPIPDGMKQLAEKRGDVYQGRGRFVGPNQVEVNGSLLEADNIVIATGSSTRPLSISGAEHLTTSDEVLSEETRPERVVFIGGGVIAMEFSHIYARAGSAVTILEAMPQLLPRLDSDAVEVMKTETKRIGVEIRTSVTVNKVVQNNDKYEVHYEHDGKHIVAPADRVVNGTGRIANVGDLNLEAANIEFDGVRITTDDYLRSVSNPAVWVAGDALTTSAQLSPVATYEGRMVGMNIVEGVNHKPDYSVIPSSVYTVPALSSVGLTEQEAEQKGIDVRSAANDMSGWFSTRTYAETAAWSKVLIDQNTDQIVGAHLIGHHGEELIHLFALAMRHSITATQLKDPIYAFPTFAADIKSMV